jgi:hypothetical protein
LFLRGINGECIWHILRTLVTEMVSFVNRSLTFLCLNTAACSIWSISVRILDLVTIWNRVVSFGPLPLNRRQSLWWDVGWVTIGLDAIMKVGVSISDVDLTE